MIVVDLRNQLRPHWVKTTFGFPNYLWFTNQITIKKQNDRLFNYSLCLSTHRYRVDRQRRWTTKWNRTRNERRVLWSCDQLPRENRATEEREEEGRKERERSLKAAIPEAVCIPLWPTRLYLIYRVVSELMPEVKKLNGYLYRGSAPLRKEKEVGIELLRTCSSK